MIDNRSTHVELRRRRFLPAGGRFSILARGRSAVQLANEIDRLQILARLPVPDAERARLRSELEQVLEWVADLPSASDVGPSPGDLTRGEWREDLVTPTVDPSVVLDGAGSDRPRLDRQYLRRAEVRPGPGRDRHPLPGAEPEAGVHHRSGHGRGARWQRLRLLGRVRVRPEDPEV